MRLILVFVTVYTVVILVGFAYVLWATYQPAWIRQATFADFVAMPMFSIVYPSLAGLFAVFFYYFAFMRKR